MTATTTAATPAAPTAEATKAKHAKLTKGLVLMATPVTVTTVATYLVHLVIAFVLSWALSHGLHLSVGVFPLSLLTYFGMMLAKLLAENVGRSWHTGAVHGQHAAAEAITQKMAVELAKTGDLSKVLGQAVLGMSGDDAKTGAYL